MAEAVAVTAQDVKRLNAWFAEQGPSWPEDVCAIMGRALRILAVLETLIGRHRKVLKTLQQAMGITPKTERGAALAGQTKQ